MELIGRQFGHIRVTEVVGEGGMGAVYAGHDQKLDRKVALKVLHADQRLDEEARERLLREARALSKVDHPNICRIHDYIETGDVDLLVLEYIDGRTLQAAIESGLSHPEKLRIALSVAEVLVRAHRAGIVHRDLKPENVMLTKTGEVKVLDFGLARWLHRGRKSEAHQTPVRDADPSVSETMAMPAARPSDIYPSGRREFLATAAGITLGTPLYMSPEQARGESLTPASDMFSFGLLLQVLFTGKEPHNDVMSAREVILRVARGETNPVEGAPKDIAAVIHQLKMYAPADRPTAVQMVERLRYQIEKPQRIVRRSIAAGVAVMMLAGGWRYTVDLDRERSIAIEQRAVAQTEKAKAEDLINFMVDDLRKKLETVGRLDLLEAPAEKVLQYVRGLNVQAMSADELARNAKVLNQLGEVRMGQGQTSAAFSLFQDSLDLSRAAVTRQPDNGEAQMVYGATHFWLGNALRTKGDLDKALPHMQSYMQVGEKLATIDPKNKDYQMEKAYGHNGLAFVLEQQGRLREAQLHYQISLEVRQKLAERFPDDLDLQAGVASAVNKLAVVFYKSGDLRKSREQSEREVKIYREIVSRDGKQAIWKQRLARSLGYLSRTLGEMAQHDASRSLLDEELALERELADLDPTNISWQRAVAITTRWIAAAEVNRGNREAALPLYRKAHAEITQLLSRSPDNVNLVVDVASIEGDYGALLSQSSDPRGLELIRSSLRRVEKIPVNQATQRFRALASLQLGDALASSSPREATEAWARAAREIQPLLGSDAAASDLALWTRILIRNDNLAEARSTLSRLQRTGYATGELERLCADKGAVSRKGENEWPRPLT